MPPGRLRKYDLIILDEVSQIDAESWSKLKTALGELNPGPMVVFVGDFQQLQPVAGKPLLQQDLNRQVELGKLPMIELRHHARARSVDPVMLDFLNLARVSQPSRETLEKFFGHRVWSSNLTEAVQKAREVERANGRPFTFLTVTNRGAANVNLARLQLEFPDEASKLAEGGGIPAELGTVVLAPGMRIRLTYNVDKERGFVNGNSGVVRAVLRPDVFVLQSVQDLPILVHPITLKGRKYLPVSYGWATTMRRAQGATLEQVAIWFDRRLADRGYAYVGISRVKLHQDAFLVGRIRRTDWLPVGGSGDQQHLSVLSESSDEEADGPSESELRSPDSESCEPDCSPESDEEVEGPSESELRSPDSESCEPCEPDCSPESDRTSLT